MYKMLTGVALFKTRHLNERKNEIKFDECIQISKEMKELIKSMLKY